MNDTTHFSSISGSMVGAFTSLPNAYTLGEKEYINQVLIKEIGGVLSGYKWLSFGLITAGIEFLGICLDNKDPFARAFGLSEDRFRLAIKELFPQKYSQFNVKIATPSTTAYDLYSELRCGVNHTTFPTPRIALSEHAHNAKHLSIGPNGHLILVAEDLYEDFKQACEEVIRRLDAGTIVEKIGLKFG